MGISLILAIKFHTNSKESILCAFTVAITLYGIINTIGNISGGCLNPAIGIVQSFFQFKIHQNPSVKNEDSKDVYNEIMWIYSLGPVLGGIIAGLFGALHENIHNQYDQLLKKDGIDKNSLNRYTAIQ